MTKPEFRPVARQNPPVLLPLETVCSARKHPLSSVSGRRRYNTLDLCTAKSCANRVLSPLLETPKSRNLQSLHNPSPFTHQYPQTENRVCDYRSINAKIPQTASEKKILSVRFRCRTHGTEKFVRHAAAVALQFSEHANMFWRRNRKRKSFRTVCKYVILIFRKEKAVSICPLKSSETILPICAWMP